MARQPEPFSLTVQDQLELEGVASENGKNRTLSIRRGRDPAV